MDNKIFYITRNKLNELKQEYEKLVKFEQSKIAGHEVPKVFESEDINSEFISFQEDINLLRLRIEELKNILANYELIKSPPKAQRAFVNLGAKVSVDLGKTKEDFIIVGTLEANPELKKISNESPVGMALLGRKVGDEVIINEKEKCKIKKIKYETS